MLRRLAVIVALLVPGAAQAHVGVGDTAGFAHGFAHPLFGVDHVLAMVAVGLLAARLGGRALWLTPLAFVSMMVVGGALGMAGVAVPFTELGIALSVVALGLVIAAGVRMPVAAAAALAGFFAIFHGHAHGAEMPAAVSGLAYGAGFVVATALLHAAGIGLGLALGRADSSAKGWVARGAGGAVALAGLVLVAGVV